MLRMAVLAAGAVLVLAGAAPAPRSLFPSPSLAPTPSRAPDPASCGAARFDAATAERGTAAALSAALDARELGDRGRTWIGKLASVGAGRRDTIVWTTDAIDATRPLDVVVYFEGYGSFADDAMDHRHAAAIAQLAAGGGNVAYVAPDAPSSSHGDRTARTPYWQAGCAARRCAGGHAAPGDFVAFVHDVRARLGALACVAPPSLDLRLHLIGFSNGGKGLANALGQLAAVDFTVDERRLAIGGVIFADGNYGAAWLTEAWAAIAPLPEAPRMTILVRDRGERGNQARASQFQTTLRGDLPRVRLLPLALSHHGVGDAAIDYVQVE